MLFPNKAEVKVTFPTVMLRCQEGHVTSTRATHHTVSQREEEDPSLDLQLLAEAVRSEVLENTLSAVVWTLYWFSF